MSPRRYETKSAMLRRLGNRSNNWLRARIEKDGFPHPVFLGGRDALFDVEKTSSWEEQHRDERIIVTRPQAVRS